MWFLVRAIQACVDQKTNKVCVGSSALATVLMRTLGAKDQHLRRGLYEIANQTDTGRLIMVAVH